MKKFITLIVCILIPLGLGAWAGIVTSSNIASWYNTLHKPSFNPPNWLFAPVWTSLYILMGISFYLIWTDKKAKDKKTAISVSIIQLLLNTLWSFLFFHFHNIFFALADILILWGFILSMIISYFSINKTAAILQIPYLAWVTFATLLNATYLYLNF